MINFYFLFAKAITEPLHAVILLVTEYWVLVVSFIKHGIIHCGLRTRNDIGSNTTADTVADFARLWWRCASESTGVW